MPTARANAWSMRPHCPTFHWYPDPLWDDRVLSFTDDHWPELCSLRLSSKLCSLPEDFLALEGGAMSDSRSSKLLTFDSNRALGQRLDSKGLVGTAIGKYWCRCSCWVAHGDALLRLLLRACDSLCLRACWKSSESFSNCSAKVILSTWHVTM